VAAAGQELSQFLNGLQRLAGAPSAMPAVWAKSRSRRPSPACVSFGRPLQTPSAVAGLVYPVS
jgi:hypothetical protein